MRESERITLLPWISLCETAVVLHNPVCVPGCLSIVPSQDLLLLSDLPTFPFHVLYSGHILALGYVLPCPCSILGSLLCDSSCTVFLLVCFIHLNWDTHTHICVLDMIPHT